MKFTTMKKIYLLSAVLTLMTGFVTSCSDDEATWNPAEYVDKDIASSLAVNAQGEHPTTATVSFNAESSLNYKVFVTVSKAGGMEESYYVDAAGSGSYTATINVAPGETYRCQAIAYDSKGDRVNVSMPAKYTCPKLDAPAAPVLKFADVASPLHIDGTDGHVVCESGFAKGLEFQLQAKEMVKDADGNMVPKKDKDGHFVWAFDKSGKPIYETDKDGNDVYTGLEELKDEDMKDAGLPTYYKYYMESLPACWMRVRVAETFTTKAGVPTEIDGTFKPKYTAKDLLKDGIITLNVSIFKDEDDDEGTAYSAVIENKGGSYTCTSVTANGALDNTFKSSVTVAVSGSTVTFKLGSTAFVVNTANGTYTDPKLAALQTVMFRGVNNNILKPALADVIVVEKVGK